MKKIIALLTTFILTLVILFTYFPETAFAFESVNIAEGGTYDLCDYGSETTFCIRTTETVLLEQSDNATLNYVKIIGIVDGVNLILNSVNIENNGTFYRALEFNGENNILLLMGDSYLGSGFNFAGIRVTEGTELTINEFPLTGGSLNVMGGLYGAGIGGDKDESGGTITIEGGTINADTWNYGAGIGGGMNGDSGTITITGGTIKSRGAGGAGIGGGINGDAECINITGGFVVGTGVDRDGGAGIGGGKGGDAIEINISGGVVCAIPGMNDACSIGRGDGGSQTGSVTISDDAVVFLYSGLNEPEPTTSHIYLPFKTFEDDKLYGVTLKYAASVRFISGLCAYLPPSSPKITYVSNYYPYSEVEDMQAPGYSINTKSADTFTRGCYNFAGWNTQSNGSGTDYATNKSVSLTKSVTLYAQWEEILATGITIDQNDLSIYAGDSTTLTTTAAPSNALNQTPTWESSNTSVATIDSFGVITAVAEGTTTITATLNENSDTITVEVAPTQVNNSGSIYLYDTMQLYSGVDPNNSSNPNVTVTISDSDVLSVDSDLLVTAVGLGTAKIDVKTNGSVNTTYTITVTERPVAGVQVIPEDTTMETGDTLKLSAVISPDDATDKSVTWSSSDTDVAIVETDGEVTAVGAGEATITAASGSFSDTCAVTVLQPVTSVDIDADALTLAVSGTAKLNASLLPANAQAAPVYWSSSDGAVASVDNTGLVTAIGIGTATITATANGKTDTCTVTVSKKDVSSVALDTTTKSLYVGDWFTLSATVSPYDASDKSVSWTSSDTSVATVTTNGTVEAVGDGACTITATADGKSASCSVSVGTKAVTDISLDYSSQSLYVGGVFALTATVKPNDAADPSITWSSSDTSVATVNSSGVVTAQAVGSCKITAKAGTKIDSCSVTVKPDPEIKVESVNLSIGMDTVMVMYVGDTSVLNANVSPSNADNKSVTWQSSDSSVATVSATGKVTAVAAGEATIRVTASDKSNSYRVLVKEREQASAETGGEEPPATTTQATQQNSQPSPSPEAEVVLSFNIDTASLPYGAQYIELPNGEIVEVNGKDTVTCDICSKDLINGTIKIVALDAEKNPLGVVDVSAEKGGLSGVMILLIAIGAVILGAGGMLLVVRAAAVKK